MAGNTVSEEVQMEKYTLSDTEWKSLALLAQCGVEAIPDYSAAYHNMVPEASLIAAVSNVIGMLSRAEYEFSHQQLKHVLIPLMETSREGLEDTPCDHSVGICNCPLGRAREIMEHVLWHATYREHHHCPKCGSLSNDGLICDFCSTGEES
jgi:hypothetical protein